MGIISQVEHMGPVFQASHPCAPKNADGHFTDGQTPTYRRKASASSLGQTQSHVPIWKRSLGTNQGCSDTCCVKRLQWHLAAAGELGSRLRLEGEVSGHSPPAPVLDHSLQDHPRQKRSGPAAADRGKTHRWLSEPFFIP